MTDRSMDRHCICYCIEDELEKCITEEFSDKILYGEYPNKDGIIDEVVEEVVRATNLEADDNATWDEEDVRKALGKVIFSYIAKCKEN